MRQANEVDRFLLASFRRFQSNFVVQIVTRKSGLSIVFFRIAENKADTFVILRCKKIPIGFDSDFFQSFIFFYAPNRLA